MVHELEADDGTIVTAWEDLPNVLDHPVELLEDVEPGTLPAPPIALDDEVGR